MAKPLAERLTGARTNPNARIADLESLITEANAERERLAGAARSAEEESVDYGLSDLARDDAAALADRYRRTSAGLSAVIAELQEKLEVKRESEAQRAKAADLAAALAERDKLVERLRTEWPAIEAQVVDLLSALKANDALLRAVGARELGAENVARGSTAALGVGMANSLFDTRLPKLDDLMWLAWPAPEKRIDPSEVIRTKRLAYEREKAAEAARWSRYMVVPPSENRQGVRISTRRGEGLISRPGEHWMTGEQVAAAKALGCRVEPLKANQSVGGSPGVAAFVA